MTERSIGKALIVRQVTVKPIPGLCLSPAPNDLYFQLTMVLEPWEQLEILQRYEGWGADRIFLRGYLNLSGDVPFDINQAALSR
jgi:hypothetical protein